MYYPGTTGRGYADGSQRHYFIKRRGIGNHPRPRASLCDRQLRLPIETLKALS
jgi:hypothetical protein